MWQEYFKLVKLVPGKVVIPKFGVIDFSSPRLTVDTCKKLYEADFANLQITQKGKEVLYGIKPAKPKRKPSRRKKKN